MTHRVALSGWSAYAPFRAAAKELAELGVEIVDGVVDRIEGLLHGTYAASPISIYALVEALPVLGDGVAVAWNSVAPRGYGSDRIIAHRSIDSIEKLYGCRIGITAQGLEPHLFEHLFDFVGLPPKTDYELFPSRLHYEAAVQDGRIDALMAPQPLRSQLTARLSHMALFNADSDLPRFGLSAPVLYRRHDWSPSLLKQTQAVVTAAASALAQLDDDALRAQCPNSFDGILNPAAEIAETVHWPSIEESDAYLASTGPGSFRDHVYQVTRLRARRFGAAPISDTQIEKLVQGVAVTVPTA